jgi:hypothetical protein
MPFGTSFNLFNFRLTRVNLEHEFKFGVLQHIPRVLLSTEPMI